MVLTRSNRGHVAVVGGGFAGLSACYQLARRGNYVTIFDLGFPGQPTGASSISAGILHPLTPRGRVRFQGKESLFATCQLLEVAQVSLNNADSRDRVILSDCLVRAVHPSCKYNTPFHTGKVDHDVFTPLTPDEMVNVLGFEPKGNLRGGIILDGLVVNTTAYLKGLWLACLESGLCDWKTCRLASLDSLKQHGEFSHVVVCAGTGVNSLMKGLLEDRLEYTIGHSITVPKPRGLTFRAGLLTGGKYILPLADGNIVCGATHQRLQPAQITEYESKETHPEAFLELASFLTSVLPSVSIEQIKEEAALISGIRVMPKRQFQGRGPLLGSHSLSNTSHISYLTAFGSHGLLYHAHAAKTLVRSIEGALLQ